MASDLPQIAGVAGRYALALFELAEETNAIDALAQELSDLKGVLDGSDDLTRLIKSPVIARADQEKAIDAVLEKAGASALARNFIGVVAKNRRLFALPDIIKAFGTLVAAHRGEVAASVVSAGALSDSQAARVKSEIEAAIGRSVNLEREVDPALLGGLVVKVGSRMIDSSLRTKLTRLKSVMKQA
ncbi:MAG: F0F1 ATP synthase subunit delta [Pseudomonadota bacterium]